MRRFGERAQVSTPTREWLREPVAYTPDGQLSVLLRDFRPDQLPGLNLWLDASDTSTITSSSGAVSQWSDKSGNGINLTQGTAANQPTTGSTTLNGLNVISFDGSNDNLRTANGALQLATVCAFIVVRSNSAARCILGVSHAAAAHTDPFFRWTIFHGDADILQIRVNGTATNSANNQLRNSIPRVLIVDTGIGDGFANASRAVDASGATVTYPNSTPFIIGTNAVNGEALNGFVAEVCIYNRSLTTAERRIVTQYLIAKWDLN